MTINIIEYIKNNLEELLTMLISTIITISVVMQRTKINRKVKDMQKLYEVELTVEEMELINNYRKETGNPEKIKRLIEPLVPTLAALEKTPDEVKEEERIKEEKEVREHHDFVKDYIETYREIKESLNFLKSKHKKYSYNKEVEKELNENE